MPDARDGGGSEAEDDWCCMICGNPPPSCGCKEALRQAWVTAGGEDDGTGHDAGREEDAGPRSGEDGEPLAGAAPEEPTSAKSGEVAAEDTTNVLSWPVLMSAVLLVFNVTLVVAMGIAARHTIAKQTKMQDRLDKLHDQVGLGGVNHLQL